jgi:hypothetical protein
MTKKKSKKLLWEIIIGVLLTVAAIIWETKNGKSKKVTSKRKKK